MRDVAFGFARIESARSTCRGGWIVPVARVRSAKRGRANPLETARRDTRFCFHAVSCDRISARNVLLLHGEGGRPARRTIS